MRMFAAKEAGAAAPAASPAEIMMRGAGLGQLVTMAKTLAGNGSIEKIMKFADDVDGLKATIAAQSVAIAELGDKLDLMATKLAETIEADNAHAIRQVRTFEAGPGFVARPRPADLNGDGGPASAMFDANRPD